MAERGTVRISITDEHGVVFAIHEFEEDDDIRALRKAAIVADNSSLNGQTVRLADLLSDLRAATLRELVSRASLKPSARPTRECRG